MKNKQDDFKLQLANMDLGALRNAIQPFSELLMRYDCAIGEVKTKIENLDMELSITHKRNPVESIKTRLKKPLSIIEKLDRLGKERTIENIDECIRDVAGVRVICTFIDDIYLMTKYLTEQDDIKLLEIKDYIKYPKPNGYRSLHLLI
ncbi:MAG: GTP pyrophosphokinase family protein, partial [Clostridia bacterium]